MTNTEITSLAINKNGHLFTGTWKGGIFRSIDDGENWEEVNTGLENQNIYFLSVSSDNYLFAGTLHGLYRTKGKLINN